MPVHLFWGEDGYRLAEAITQLRERILDPLWLDFNWHRLGAEEWIEALNLSVTPPFGAGGRLVCLEPRASAEFWAELERTLPRIPDSTYLLLVSSARPEEKLKKLVQKYGDISEFDSIPPWREDKLKAQVQQMAQARGLSLSPQAVQLLAEAVGNDTRRLDGELVKLGLYTQGLPVDEHSVSKLVTATAHTSFQLARALLDAQSALALDILEQLLDLGEPALRILAVLSNQFRTWLWVRLLIEAGERDKVTIARAAEIHNPNRVFFLQKEVERTTAQKLSRVMPLLLDCEVQLKSGGPDRLALQTLVLRITTL